MEVCDEWYPDPDEWRSTWTSKDGGPVKAAMEEWERETEKFFNEEFSKLKEDLETQGVQSGTQVHQKAMTTRVESFARSMTIKLRVLDESELLEAGAAVPSGSTPDEDHRSEVTKKTGKTFLSGVTQFTQLTKRARQIKTQMLRVFKKNHKLEESDVMQMQQRIGGFIIKHGGRVEQYRLVLKCSAIEVENDMRQGMDEVWNSVIGCKVVNTTEDPKSEFGV
ncbi:hypothetical protein FRC11_010787 [Ceratobasidium sp. 423]|nr:hypothetical protein FRC11_010787 [Ceratobasidium sp. 423]